MSTQTNLRAWSRVSQAIRWRLRGLLRMLPARRDAGLPESGAVAPPAPARIAYMFAGTYGDFAQALPPIRRLAAAFPGSEILLHGAVRYAREFASELPPGLRIVPSLEPFRWIPDRVDLLLTNCVGVYRVRLDYAAGFCARRAFGFRHAHEARRGGYSSTIPLMPEVRSFAEENLKLLDLAGVPAVPAAGQSRKGAPGEEPGLPPDGAITPWGRGGILFHIGSAGLKRDFGLKTYSRLVLAILNRMEGRPVEVVMGPGDEDVALEVRSGTGFVPQMFPLPRLIRMLRSFEGTLLCFNSFPAHICRYLGRPAVVIHREAVPYGYDCAPLHRQVVLTSATGWDLDGVWDALRVPAA